MDQIDRIGDYNYMENIFNSEGNYSTNFLDCQLHMSLDQGVVYTIKKKKNYGYGFYSHESTISPKMRTYSKRIRLIAEILKAKI